MFFAALDDVSSAVIDLGSYETRAGYSGEDCPRSIIPSLVGAFDTRNGAEDIEMLEGGHKDKIVVGSAGLNYKQDHMAIRPLYQEDGMINFDYLEEILEYTMVKSLMLPPKDTPLLFTESSVHNKDIRMKLTEFLFEKFKVPAFFICKDAVLSSFACGRSTAVVIDSGNSYTTATPVHDGYALQKCIMRSEIGGKNISN